MRDTDPEEESEEYDNNLEVDEDESWVTSKIYPFFKFFVSFLKRKENVVLPKFLELETSVSLMNNETKSVNLYNLVYF